MDNNKIKLEDDERKIKKHPKSEQKQVKSETKNEEKEIKKEVKKEIKKEVKQEIKKEIKQETNQEIKQEINQEVKKDIKKEIKREEDNKILAKRKAEVELEKTLNDSKSVKKAVKVGTTNEIQGVNKWWEDSDEGGDDTKWNYLEHNGILFPNFWVKHNVKPLYNGEPIELNSYQEEMATYWSQTIGTEWETKKTYRDNFSEEFCKTFKDEKKNFEKFDFNSIVKYLEEQREIKKNRSIEEKRVLNI